MQSEALTSQGRQRDRHGGSQDAFHNAFGLSKPVRPLQSGRRRQLGKSHVTIAKRGVAHTSQLYRQQSTESRMLLMGTPQNQPLIKSTAEEILVFTSTI